VKIRSIHKTIKSVAPKGITHEKLLTLMKAILPSKNIIGGYLKSITPSLHANLKCKCKNQQSAIC